MSKPSTSDKIITILDKLEVEDVLKTFYAIRDYLGKRIEEKTNQLVEQQNNLKLQVDKINK